MTVTDDRPAATEARTEHQMRGGIGLVAFLLGFGVMLHVVVLVGLGVLAARSDSLDERRAANDPVGGAETVFIATEFAYDPSAGTGTAGGLTLTLVNQGEIFHNLLIEEVRGFVLEADSGVTASAQLDLEEGVYIIYCNVPGHRDAGMEGTLTISPT